MKKYIFTFFICILLISCSSTDELIFEKSQAADSSFPSFYSVQEAIELANKVSVELDIPGSRGVGRRADPLGVCDYIVSASRNADSPFYVVNYENDQGYAIIAKKRIEILL